MHTIAQKKNYKAKSSVINMELSGFLNMFSCLQFIYVWKPFKKSFKYFLFVYDVRNIYLTIYLSVCLTVRPSVRPSIYLSIYHLPIYLISIYSSIYLSTVKSSIRILSLNLVKMSLIWLIHSMCYYTCNCLWLGNTYWTIGLHL